MMSRDGVRCSSWLSGEAGGALNTGAASAEPLGCAGVIGKQARRLEWRDGDHAGDEGGEERDQRTKAVGYKFSMHESPGASRYSFTLEMTLSLARMRCCPRGWSSTWS